MTDTRGFRGAIAEICAKKYKQIWHEVYFFESLPDALGMVPRFLSSDAISHMAASYLSKLLRGCGAALGCATHQARHWSTLLAGCVAFSVEPVAAFDAHCRGKEQPPNDMAINGVRDDIISRQERADQKVSRLCPAELLGRTEVSAGRYLRILPQNCVKAMRHRTLSRLVPVRWTSVLSHAIILERYRLPMPLMPT